VDLPADRRPRRHPCRRSAGRTVAAAGLSGGDPVEFDRYARCADMRMKMEGEEGQAGPRPGLRLPNQETF